MQFLCKVRNALSASNLRLCYTKWIALPGRCRVPPRTRACGTSRSRRRTETRARTSGFAGRWREPVFRPRQMPRRRAVRACGSRPSSAESAVSRRRGRTAREVRAASGADSRTYLTRRGRRLRRRIPPPAVWLRRVRRRGLRPLRGRAYGCPRSRASLHPHGRTRYRGTSDAQEVAK